MTDIIHISRANLLSGRTNVYNLAKTCEALNAEQDLRVRLVTTNKKVVSDAAFFERMAVLRPFLVTCLGATDTTSPCSGKKWY